MRPSALPMLAACPCWESSESTGRDYKNAGTLRHEALGKFLSETPGALDGLSEEDAAAVEWAAEYIRVKAPMSDYPLRLEFHVNPLDAEFKPIFENGGTLDVACGPVLFDLKSRERDYAAQMAAYALHMFQEHGWPEVEVHLLFTETRRAQVFKFTEAEAAVLVNGIVANVKDPQRKATPCDYCSWCSRQLTCPAKLAEAARVARERQDVPPELKAGFDAWLGAGAHSSQLDDPAIMGMVLKVARVLADWCDSVEHHAKEMAVKQGKIPAGFKLQTRQGNRFITSVTDAFSRLGLPQEEFLKACEIKPSAAFEAYATFNGLKKATAEKEAERKLGDAIQRKASTISLVAEKS